jgi:hypothetical protein
MSELTSVRDLWIKRAKELLEKGRELPDGEGGVTYTQPSAKDLEVILKGLAVLADDSRSANDIVGLINRLGQDERYRNIRYAGQALPAPVHDAVDTDEAAA